MSIFGFIATTLADSLGFINPASIEKTFDEMKAGPVIYLRIYLLLIGLPLFLGYYLFFSTFQENVYPPSISLKLALMYYLIAVTLPMVMGYVLYLFDVRLVRAKVTYPEALTLFTYAFTIPILSGMLRVKNETWVLHIIALVYGLYLAYTAMDQRYGKERSVITPYIFIVLVGMLSAALLTVFIKLVLGISWDLY